MKFKYFATDAKNKNQKGVIEAPNLKEATQLLLGQGWFIKKIAPKGRASGGGREISFGGVSLLDKALFVKHLSTMLKSGISINEALEVISEQSSSSKFRKIINNVLEQVKAGQGLGKALEKYPKVFDPLYINIIKVGEDSGTLEENLEYLANELEDRLELIRNIKAASFYPVIILVSTAGLALVLSYFVLPQITRLFTSLDFQLPISTRILLFVANVMDQYGLWVIGGFIGSLIGFKVLISQNFAKPAWHWFLLKVPIIGGTIINYNLVMMNRTLSILLKSGQTIDQSIKITIQTTNNRVYKKKIKQILPQIQKGKTLSSILSGFKQSRRHPLFPLLVIKMISVGERSGRLDESLSYISSYFAKEVDNTTKNLTTVIEPILLISVGLAVGFIAISVISPIYQITGQFRN